MTPSQMVDPCHCQLGNGQQEQCPVQAPCGPPLAVMNLSFHCNLNVSFFSNHSFTAKSDGKKTGCLEKIKATGGKGLGGEGKS